MTDKEPDLAEIIVHFLSKLPDTIRSDILVFVLFYAFDFDPIKGMPGVESPRILDTKMVAELRRRLLDSKGLERIGAVIRSASSTDHVLARFVATEHANESRLPRLVQNERTAPNIKLFLQKMMLGREFRLRHAEAALQSWRALRDNELSPSSLIGFEDRCLRLPNQK
jgi:hypothetical protein